MKKKTSPKAVMVANDDIRPVYDFSGGVRGKYAKTLREKGYTIRIHYRDGTVTEKRVLGENAVSLAPDVREYFPTSQAVNRALRTLISLIPDKRKAIAKKARSTEHRSATKRQFKA